MFTVIKKDTRPNKLVKFYFELNQQSPEFNKYFYEKFIRTGKFISSNREISSDGISLLLASKWRSHKDLLEFMGDDICYNHRLAESQYNAVNGIVSHISSEED